jgi:hypothetical protein
MQKLGTKRQVRQEAEHKMQSDTWGWAELKLTD